MKFSQLLNETNQNYGHNFELKEKFSDGFRNDVFWLLEGRQNYVLILYKKERHILRTIKCSHAIAFYLDANNFPVRLPIKNNKKAFYFKFYNQRYAALYNYLPGKTIPWEAYTKRHLKGIGKILSNMHFSLEKFDSLVELPSWKSLIIKEGNEMIKYINKVLPWISAKLFLELNMEKVIELIDIIKNYSSAENNPLHYDFVRGNILFSNKLLEDDTYEITGIIDFEKVCRGPLLADISRTLAFLYVDCKYKTEKEVYKWFFIRGYFKRGKLKFVKDIKLLELFAGYFLLRDFWKFLEHNPYESLWQNEHFIRTRDKLLERKYLIKLK